MNRLEHFKQIAAIMYPHFEQCGVTLNGRFVFDSPELQKAWMCFQHAFTVRPTENSRLDKATFGKGDNPATLVDRLQGMFPTADPPYPVPEIQYEAAREIVRLREQLALSGGDADKLVSDLLAKQNNWSHWATGRAIESAQRYPTKDPEVKGFIDGCRAVLAELK